MEVLKTIPKEKLSEVLEKGGFLCRVVCEVIGKPKEHIIEVNKGVDKTYVADFQASDPSYFELYGYAGQSHGSVAQLTSNDNAVGLIMGTLKVGTNVDLGALNTGGNYNVSEGAELWIDGGSAFKNGGTAMRRKYVPEFNALRFMSRRWPKSEEKML